MEGDCVAEAVTAQQQVYQSVAGEREPEATGLDYGKKPEPVPLACEQDGTSPFAELMKSAINEVNNLKELYDSNSYDTETFLETLPDDCTYKVTTLRGTSAKFHARILTADLTKENYKDWLAEYDAINNTCTKLKTTKSQTTGYLLQNYYRCHHNTRKWCPSKDPQRKLTTNPTARVKNTNCPFQLVLKISTEGCTTIDIHWEHNHSVCTLEASNFKDLSEETIEKVYKLFESGHTPSTARQQFLKDIRRECKDDITYHQRKADRAITPRRRDFSHLYAQFGKENYGGKDRQMFAKLVERLKSYEEENPEASTSYQLYEGDSQPLIIALVTPLMKRVHKEVQQSGELVFIDATSNTEEHNLKVFMLCTHHVAGALPLGIVITSDEKEGTLCQGFQTLKSILPSHAFYGHGPDAGPDVILTDNCDEERNALTQTWPGANLLLCTFHVLQQVWKWLHDKNHNIKQDDRPYLLSLFKRCLYAETEETFQNCCADMFEDDKCKQYANFITYLSNLCDKKEAFALCFRTHLPVRGNHTNNFVEAQFLVLKDTILRRVKEYNVVGLLERITTDLEDHYKTKLLSLADGSFDGHYRHRFMGKGKDGATGFAIPTPEQQSTYLSSVQQFDNNIFTVASGSRPEQSYTVDMTVGTCSCSVGKDGSPCKHQYVLWAANKSHCPNFVAVTDSVERQKLAKIAIGETLPLSFYSNLRTASCIVTPETPPATSTSIVHDHVESVDMEAQEQSCEGQEAHVETDSESCIESASTLLHKSFEQITQKLNSTNDTNLARAIMKFSKRVTRLTGPTTMPSNLIAALHNFGTNELKKNRHRKKNQGPAK
ncbi:uncharacterized protein LOC144919399 [Branchiostoma floridae x Branchiostoma belcheri]